MNTAVVTGANGFVGKSVVKELSNKGIKVLAVIRATSAGQNELKAMPGVEVLYCEMKDYNSKLLTMLGGRKADVFYHFAWQGSAGAQRADEKVQMQNVLVTLDAVRAAHAMGCKLFIFAGSIMEYEIDALMRSSKKIPASSMYSVAKRMANYSARILANNLGIGYIAAIISNIYGPGETSPRLINTSLRKMMQGEHTSFSPGEQMYDFVYLTDASRMFVALGEKGKDNTTYYIGSEHPQPLKKFLLEMAELATPGQTIGLGELPFEGESLTYCEFDTKACARDTGVRSLVSFREGVQKTMDWIKQFEGKG